MSKYTEITDWYIRELDDYISVNRLSWEVGKEGSGLFIHVEPGFEFEVSVPWYARWIYDRHDPRFLKASCLHDWALETGWSRTSAASLFADALAADGVSRLKRLVATLAVIIINFK